MGGGGRELFSFSRLRVLKIVNRKIVAILRSRIVDSLLPLLLLPCPARKSLYTLHSDAQFLAHEGPCNRPPGLPKKKKTKRKSDMERTRGVTCIFFLFNDGITIERKKNRARLLLAPRLHRRKIKTVTLTGELPAQLQLCCQKDGEKERREREILALCPAYPRDARRSVAGSHPVPLEISLQPAHANHADITARTGLNYSGTTRFPVPVRRRRTAFTRLRRAFARGRHAGRSSPVSRCLSLEGSLPPRKCRARATMMTTMMTETRRSKR